MKILINILIITLAISVVYSLDIDSLKNVINISEGDIKAEALNRLAEEYQSNDPEQSIRFSEEALYITDKSGNDSLYCYSLKNIGVAYYFLSDYSKSREYLDKAQKLANKNNFKSIEASCINNLGLVFKKMDNWDQALTYFLASLEFEQNQNNKIGEAQSYCNIGNLYYELGNKHKALEYYQSSLMIYEDYDDIEGLATTLNNLGVIYDEDEQYSVALDYYLKSLEYEEASGNKLGTATSLTNIGLSYYNLGLSEKAEEYLNKSLQETLIIGEKYGIANNYINLGMVLIEIKEYDRSLQYLNKGLQLSIEIKSRDLINNANGLLSKLYTEKKDFEKALLYLKKATEDIKDYTTAKEYSINNVEQQIYDNTKEQEINNLKKSNSLYLILIIFIVLFFLSTLIIILFNRYKLRENLITEMQVANNQLMEMARTDPLTALANRRGMLEKIEYEIYRYERNKKSFVLVMGDIDDFKKINDRFGHECGDFILKSLSNTMISVLRKQDIVGRWGGEEFLLMLPETELNGGMLVMEKIRKMIDEQSLYYKGNVLHITITFGVVEYDNKLTVQEVIDRADQALYDGKNAGKNRVNPATAIPDHHYSK